MVRLLEKHRRLVSPSPDVTFVGVAEGQQVLDHHRSRPARLLILDTKMPGLTPEEICRQVRTNPDLRRVSLIVIGTPESVPQLERCMANRSFVRPLDQEDFLGAVRCLINVAARTDYRVLIGVRLGGMVRKTPFFGKSENISATGILFSTNRILDLGDQVDLMFVLPGQGKLNTKAEILRAETIPGSATWEAG